MPNVLAFAEARGGELRKVAYEAVTAARSLAGDSGEVHAMLVGAPGIATKAGALGRYGADVVYVTEHDAFATSNPEATAALVAERAKGGGYRAVVFSASRQGLDLAPRVAGKLAVPIAADVTTVALDGDVLVAQHPAYTTKINVTERVTASPLLASIRPGAIL